MTTITAITSVYLTRRRRDLDLKYYSGVYFFPVGHSALWETRAASR